MAVEAYPLPEILCQQGLCVFGQQCEKMEEKNEEEAREEDSDRMMQREMSLLLYLISSSERNEVQIAYWQEQEMPNRP